MALILLTANPHPLFSRAGINNLGSLTIMHSTFSGNMGDQGGAIRNSGVLTISDSIFIGNSAADGGAILNDLGLRQFLIIPHSLKTLRKVQMDLGAIPATLEI